MVKELFPVGMEARLVQFHFVSIPFHVDFNLTSLQGLRLIHPVQKLLYLFTQTLVLLKVIQSESERIRVCVHAHTGSCSGGVGG